MDEVVLRPGEGESLFSGRIVLKATFEQLCITESLFPDARDGAEPHFHRRHADSFYVLEGELAVLVRDEEKPVSAGAFVCAPPEVVHGFRSTTRTRFLNFHTPDGDFADHLRVRNRGKPGGFDSVDVPAGTGPPATGAVFLRAGEGERLEANNRVATIKVGRDEHVDSFYVLEGEPEFLLGDEKLRLGAGSFVAAPIGVVHTFANPGSGRARLLNVHAPSRDFHEFLRKES